MKDIIESNSTPVTESGCWLWMKSLRPDGYGRYANKYAHRVSYTLHKGAIPDGMQINHTCDERSCVNPNHLYLGTQQDNMNDKVLRNRQDNRGEKHSQNKLTERDVLAIRARKKAGEVMRDIHRDYQHVSYSAVKSCANGTSWRHI